MVGFGLPGCSTIKKGNNQYVITVHVSKLKSYRLPEEEQQIEENLSDEQPTEEEKVEENKSDEQPIVYR